MSACPMHTDIFLVCYSCLCVLSHYVSFTFCCCFFVFCFTRNCFALLWMWELLLDGNFLLFVSELANCFALTNMLHSNSCCGAAFYCIEFVCLFCLLSFVQIHSSQAHFFPCVHCALHCMWSSNGILWSVAVQPHQSNDYSVYECVPFFHEKKRKLSHAGTNNNIVLIDNWSWGALQKKLPSNTPFEISWGW